MKLNTRFFALAAAFGAVTAANAGDVRFYLGYGDAAFAALNGKAVGDELSTSLPNAVPGIGNTFTVSLFAVYQGTAASANYGGGNFFLGFDTATTNNSTSGYANQGAAETAGVSKAIKLASGFSGLATGLPGVNAGNDTTVDIAQLAAPKFRGEANGGSAQTLRSIGINWSFGFGTGNSFKMTAGTKYRMVNMVVTNLTIAGTDVYGDTAGENGLTLNSLASGVASSGVNIFGSTRAGMNDATVKYALGNPVPEPGTMLAIGAGLVALARRRRK